MWSTYLYVSQYGQKFSQPHLPRTQELRLPSAGDSGSLTNRRAAKAALLKTTVKCDAAARSLPLFYGPLSRSCNTDC